MTIANLVETTWLSRYPWPSEITYGRGSEFLGHRFKNNLIEEEYDIIAKPVTVGNPQYNSIIEIIHQALENLIRTFDMEKNYVDEDDPWKRILAAEAFYIHSTFHTTKKKSPRQLVLGRYMIVPIDHIANWRLIYQLKQTLIYKNTNKQNSTRTNQHFKVDDQVLIRDNQANKYKTPYMGPYTTIQTWNNGIITLRMGKKTDKINIGRLKPYYK